MEGTVILNLWSKVIVVAMAAVTVYALLTVGRRRSAHWYLAVFLILLGANYALEASRVLLGAQPRINDVIGRLAAVFSAVDPLFFYYFFSLYPTRNALNRPRAVAVVVASTGLLTMGVLGRLGGFLPFDDRWLDLYWSTHTAVIYMVVFGRLLRRGEGSAGARNVLVAAAVAALPSVHRVATTWFGDSGPVVLVHFSLVPLLGLLVLLLSPSRAMPAARLRPWGAFLVAEGISLFMLVFGRLPFTGGILGLSDSTAEAMQVLYQFAGSARWIIFMLFMTLAVVRHQALDLKIGVRRMAARGLVASGFAGVAGIGYGIVVTWRGGVSSAISIPELVLFVAVVALSQGFHRLLDRVTHRVYGIPPASDARGRIRIFEEAVRQSKEAGRDPGADAGLEALRIELGMDARTAQVLIDGQVADGGAPLGVGRIALGRWDVKRLIGVGGGGRTYLARDRLLARDVVLKEIFDAEPGSGRALEEARIAGSLQHPNVLAVHDVFATGGSHVIVSPYLSGGTLAQRLESGGGMREADVAGIADSLLSGLEHVHARGIVHRDIKPQNILFSADEVPVLIDFGVARLRSGETLSVGPGPVVGTAAYMAPEQSRGGAVDHRADLFSIGRVIHEMVDGESPAIEEILARATAQDPDARWSTAREMREALVAAFRSDAARPDSKPTKGHSHPRRTSASSTVDSRRPPSLVP